MFALVNNLISSVLVAISTLGNPATPAEPGFGASAYVTANNQIRLSISKPTDERLTVQLRDADGHVLFQKHVAKNENKSAILFSVEGLTDGQYEIQVRSKEASVSKVVTLSTKVQEPVRQIAMQ